MKERLIIKNFGPIKSVDLELGKMNILIGESASGKSTVAKVLSICRYFSYIVFNEGIKEIEKDFIETALKDWDLNNFETKSTYWRYENEDYIFEINAIRNKLITFLKPKSEVFTELINEIKDRGIDDPVYSDWAIPNSYFFNKVKKTLNNPFYIPTERGLQSLFSLGKSSIQNVSDTLYNQFAKFDLIFKKFKSDIDIEPLNLVYRNENGKGLFKENDKEKFFSMIQAASGFKSTIPIVLLVKNYSLLEKRSKTFIIEEPELNLYPKAQKKLVEFLTYSINDFDHQMLLTTHSPYILTALENLMYAFKMGNIADGKYKEQVKEIVPEKYWINAEDVNVYFLGKDGSVDLMQRDYALINKDYIDSVSDNINEQFDRLLALDVAHENNSEE